MILVFEVLAVLAVVFGVAAFLTGRAAGLSEEPQDLASVGIPRDRAMTPDDVVGLRFALALRGYRMDEVDDALDRLAAEIAARDEEIARLRAQAGGGAEEAAAPPAVSDEERWGGGEATVATPVVDEGEYDDEPEDDDVTDPVDDTTPAGDTPVPASPAPALDPDPDATVAWSRRSADDYVASDATGDVPADTPVDVPTTPQAWSALDPSIPVETGPDTPTFVEPPAPPSPFRPEVPEIPTYDPWSVTPRSRYTEGPTYVEVGDDDEGTDPVDSIAEHQTGYAPAPAPADEAADEDGRP